MTSSSSSSSSSRSSSLHIDIIIIMTIMIMLGGEAGWRSSSRCRFISPCMWLPGSLIIVSCGCMKCVPGSLIIISLSLLLVLPLVSSTLLFNVCLAALLWLLLLLLELLLLLLVHAAGAGSSPPACGCLARLCCMFCFIWQIMLYVLFHEAQLCFVFCSIGALAVVGSSPPACGCLAIRVAKPFIWTFTGLAETRLAQHICNYINIA